MAKRKLKIPKEGDAEKYLDALYNKKAIQDGTALAPKDIIGYKQKELQGTKHSAAVKNIPAPQTVYATPTKKEREATAKAIERENATVPVNKWPLHYMNNPTHLVGDFISGAQTAAGVPLEDQSNVFDTSAEDAKEYYDMKGDYTAQLQKGNSMLPGAALNVGLAMAGAPQGSGGLGIANEMFNPIAGMYSSVRAFPRNYANKRSAKRSDKRSVKKVQLAADVEFKNLTSPEGRKRLEDMGIDYDKFIDKVTKTDMTTTTSGGSFQNSTTNKLNVDTNQVRNEGNGAYSEGSVFAHELAHLLQDKSILKNPHSKELPDYRSLEWFAKAIGIPPEKVNTAMFYKIGAKGYSTRPTAPTVFDTFLDGITPKKGMDGEAFDRWEYFKNAKGNYGTDIDNQVERLAYVREFRQSMVEKGVINNVYDKITEKQIGKFMRDNPQLRMSQITEDTPNNIGILRKVMNTAPVLVGGAALVKGANVAGQEQPTNEYEQGGFIQANEFDTFRHQLETGAVNKQFQYDMNQKHGEENLNWFLENTNSTEDIDQNSFSAGGSVSQDYVDIPKYRTRTENMVKMNPGISSHDTRAFVSALYSRDFNSFKVGGYLDPAADLLQISFNPATQPQATDPVQTAEQNIKPGGESAAAEPSPVGVEPSADVTQPLLATVSGSITPAKGQLAIGDNPAKFNRFFYDGQQEFSSKQKRAFRKVHYRSGSACTAGALNCATDFVSPYIAATPLRTLLANNSSNDSQYKIKSGNYRGSKDYIPNQSIDAWEIHQKMMGEGIGTSMLDSTQPLTYTKHKSIPDQIDPYNLSLGTVIGQGDSRGFYTSDADGKRSRHTMYVVGWDKVDGMAMVYDYGNLVRLDQAKTLTNVESRKMSQFTVPQGYDKYTREFVQTSYDNRKKELGYDQENLVEADFGKKYPDHIINTGNKFKDKIGWDMQVPQAAMNSLVRALPGIANAESKINSSEETSIRSLLADNFVGNAIGGKPVIKGIQQAWYNTSNYFTDEEKTRVQEYHLELEANARYPEDDEKYAQEYERLKEENDKLDYTTSGNYTSSVGPFAIKDMPQYAIDELGLTKSSLYGATTGTALEITRGSMAALTFLAQNYKMLENKYEDLSEAELVELAIVSYNNKEKTEDPDFVKNYIEEGHPERLVDEYLSSVLNFVPTVE